MKKFRVTTSELHGYTCEYIVEAESEEDVKDIDYMDLQKGFQGEDFDYLEKCEIENIEEI